MKKIAIGILSILILLLAAMVGAGADPTELVLNTPTNVTIDEAGETVYFSFIPEKTARYKYYSTGDGDTYGLLYNSNMDEIATNDAGYKDLNFEIVEQLTAGTQYYVGARYFYPEKKGTFTVQIEEYEGLISAETAGSNTYYVDYGETVTLQVNALCSSNCELIYEWYDNNFNRIENAKSDTFTTGNITSSTQYSCWVGEPFGRSITISFYIYVQNHFSVSALDGYQRYVEKNNTTTLAVQVSCDDDEEITYQWFVEVVDEYGIANFEPVLNATTNTITTEKVTRQMVYYCYVCDKYGNSGEVYFNIYIDNHLTAERAGNYTTYVDLGKEANLEVRVNCSDGSITYQWYRRVYDEDEQSWEAETIEGANAPTLKTEKLNQNTVFVCEVKDTYDNYAWVEFKIQINNDFWAGRDGSPYIYIEPDSPAVLRIKAGCNDGPLSYVWYRWTENESGDSDWEIIDDADNNTYTTDPLSYYTRFYCYVSDKYGNKTSIDFNVYIDNKLTVFPNGSPDRLVSPDGTVELLVTATRTKGKLTYQWAQSYYDENHILQETVIQGADTNTYIAGPYAKNYKCTVSDEYGNDKTVWFYVGIDNDFKVLTSRGSQIFFCNQGEDVTLICYASCADQTLSYRWNLYDPSDGWNRIDGVTTNTCTLKNLSAYSRVNCYVKDQYGNNSTVYYDVYVSDHMQTMNVGETKRIQLISGEENFSFFSLRPAESGAYRLSTPENENGDDVYVSYTAYLLDADRNVLEELYVGYYDHPSFDLVGDTQYYLAILCGSYYSFDHFDIRLVGSNHLVAFCENGRTYEWGSLRFGEPMTLKVYAFCDYGPISYQWYSDEGPILGATSSTYTVHNLEDNTTFECLVSDDTGDSIRVSYDIDPIRFEIWPKGNEFNYVEEGETVTLEVESWVATGVETSYTWYYERQIIEGATSNSYSFQAASNNMGTYECRLTQKGEDSDNGYNWCGFTVALRKTDTPTALILNTETIATITEAGEPALFSFTPALEGTYILTWHYYRAIGYLYDASWNIIDSFSFYGDDAVPYVHDLESGKTYYYVMTHSDNGTDPIIIEMKELSPEESERSVKIQAMNTMVEKDEEFALIITSEQGDEWAETVELWATEGNDTYIEKRWPGTGYSISTINYISSRPKATVITYFARTFYDEGNYKDSEPVTVTVLDTIEDMGEVSFTTETENGAIAVTVTCPNYVESGMVSIWNGSTFYNKPYTVQNPVVVMENVLPGRYSVSVSASATGYRGATVSRRVIAHASTKLILPSMTTVIEDEAFFGSAALEIVLPDYCTTIGDGAFADCTRLRMIYMPDSVVNIDGNAFSGSEQVIFLCESDNAAADYARNKGIDYIFE